MKGVTLQQARSAKDAVLQHFQQFGEVAGVGITRIKGEYGIKVNLRRPPAADAVLPTEVDGVPVRIEVTGGTSPRRPTP